MATAKGIAKMSTIFDQAYEKPIDEEAYPLWLEIFVDVDDEDLREAALSLAKNREQYMRGLVTPDEITRELRFLGVRIYHSKEDAAFANSSLVKALTQEAEGEPVSLAEFRKTDEEGGRAICGVLGNHNG